MKYDRIVTEPMPPWTERDGVISFSVTSNGMSGKAWIAHFEAKGSPVGMFATSVLLSPRFVPTNGVTTEIRVLKGILWQSDRARTSENIREEATRRELVKPNAELACLIRDMFSDAEIAAMGLWGIVAMHDPIEGSHGNSNLLTAYCRGDYSLHPYDDRPDRQWDDYFGFAFVVASQVS
ncbi:MAG: hypothetical protein AAB431_00385 [Patescibacteria group bacterium]